MRERRKQDLQASAAAVETTPVPVWVDADNWKCEGGFGARWRVGRGERVQLLEELSLQEGALRETRIGGIQDAEELKRIQERQIDDLSEQN